MGGYDVAHAVRHAGRRQGHPAVAQGSRSNPRTDDNPYDYQIMGTKFRHGPCPGSSTGVDVIRLHDTSGVDHLVAGFRNGQSWVSLSRPAWSGSVTDVRRNRL